MVEVVNAQRKIKIKRQIYQKFAENLLSQTAEIRNGFFTVAFVSDKKIRQLNRQFRGKDKTTDVLSFPFQSDKFNRDENNLGEIIISAEQAAKQSEENHLDFETEIKQLILHGILHLCGYDHETDRGEMNALELKLRDKLQI